MTFKLIDDRDGPELTFRLMIGLVIAFLLTFLAAFSVSRLTDDSRLYTLIGVSLLPISTAYLLYSIRAVNARRRLKRD